jgi:hypothetical protein
MKNILIGFLFAIAVVVFMGCKKQPSPQSVAPSESKPSVQTPVVEEPKPAQSPVAKTEKKLEPISIVLPKPMFVGTPENLAGIQNLEPDAKTPRPQFLAPQGVKNLSLNKPVIGSEMEPITGKLAMIVDGDKEATEGSVVELGPFKQWVQVDLEAEYELYAIVFWHFHKTARVYYDVVVQVSNDKEFITEVTTLFNNDIDNSLGLGVGSDKHYIDKAEGKLVDAKGTKARYVRLYSQGNNQNDYSVIDDGAGGRGVFASVAIK